ncbi:MAG TPA: hypothetical protein DCW47_06720 [Lachnospiraceae bacterium]|nr:hypothetical protein [Lachnospiraceae bacterium]
MKNYSVERLTKIAISLSSEKDIDNLLDAILKEAMMITNCDGGTVYVYDDDEKLLRFHRLITKSKGFSMGGHGEPVNLPPVKLNRSHICACSAMDHKRIYIEDTYKSEVYDFSGAQKYDSLNDYRTVSMLVIPMEDEKGSVIGVLQLINAMDEDGNIIKFADDLEEITAALASLAAVSLTNRKLARNVYDLLHSFVQVMVGAVDTRTPYNAAHTRHMVRYAERFMDWLEETDNSRKFSENERDPFIMSVWLHDIGKLVVPLKIMDKQTRLGELYEKVRNRLEVGQLMERIDRLEHPERKEASLEREKALKQAWETIKEANDAVIVREELQRKLEKISGMECMTSDGSRVPVLTEKEYSAITVKKGTLTEEERIEMEKHVEYTSDFLSRMKFGGFYRNVPKWASSHHEFLDGSGYPKHYSGDDLSKEVRIITILDIYDSLTAEDRPYKPPIPKERAFLILNEMAEQGKIDGELLKLFEESGAWK